MERVEKSVAQPGSRLFLATEDIEQIDIEIAAVLRRRSELEQKLEQARHDAAATWDADPADVATAQADTAAITAVLRACHDHEDELLRQRQEHLQLLDELTK